MIDPRFKLVYFEDERCQEYTQWLIMEAEKAVEIEVKKIFLVMINYDKF